VKRALVLAGGGAKGAYEAGYIKALNELGMEFQIVTGTSIGALNGCLVTQHDEQKLFDLWQNMDISQVFAGEWNDDFHLDFDSLMNQSHLVLSFFKKYVKEKGADITPLKKMIRNMLDEDKFMSSDIDFGLCTVKYPSLKPVMIKKKEMPKNHIYDYLLASASCFPVFPLHTFENQSYIDGGYYDNVPIDLAFDMGADEVLVVDMNTDITHGHYLNRPHVIYSFPYVNLGGFMDFSKESMEINYKIGYQTAMKTMNQYVGIQYTFQPFENEIFHLFYKEVLYMERYIRMMLRTDNAANKMIETLQSHKKVNLLEKDYVYCVLDWLLELLERPVAYVYQFDLVVKDLLTDFQKYMEKDYQMVSLHSFEDMTQTLKNINRKGIVGRLLHAMIYPYEEKIDVEKFLTLFPKEVLMARLLFLLIK